MIRIIATALTAALATASIGYAEGRINYTADAGKMGKMEMTERWRDDALRMEIAGRDAYMLLRGEEIYSVTAASGQIMVLPLGQLKDMAGAAGSQGPSADKAGVVFPDSIEKIRKTGEMREVAGISGEVHEIDWIDNTGTARTDTAVLTDDPQMLEHQDLKIRFIRAVSDEEPNTLLSELEARGLAALSFGDRFRVTALSDEAGPAGNFELPAEPIDFGDMMNMGNQ